MIKNNMEVVTFEISQKLKHIPRNEDVKRKRPRKLFGFSFGEDYCYVKGWYRTVPMHKVKYEFTNYCVKTYR